MAYILDLVTGQPVPADEPAVTARPAPANAPLAAVQPFIPGPAVDAPALPVDLREADIAAFLRRMGRH